MIREIYTRDINDPNYEEGTLENTKALELILAKIRMILGTNHGDVLGEYNLGTNIEEMVFKTTKDAQYIERELENQIMEYIDGLGEYAIHPKVKFGHHEDGYDYAEIDINVNDVRIQTYLID